MDGRYLIVATVDGVATLDEVRRGTDAWTRHDAIAKRQRRESAADGKRREVRLMVEIGKQVAEPIARAVPGAPTPEQDRALDLSRDDRFDFFNQ
jgi:hypothetical protein